ncbi:hypothetical protein M9H77_03218 [Catharanthus roseus]|uniref:Uncharacterized protein n=1 Tax=Catharanthus roseus TaxID=4058 RepID=A0ACC0CAS7_CATRO|nr:hypothetical protein M9H77_03218 [Catharanthus roseus]
MNATSHERIGTIIIMPSKGLGIRNGYYDISCKRVPRNDVRNGGNYVTMEERFHKRKDSSRDEGGKLAYKSIKTINFFPSNSYLSFEIYFKDIKLFSLVFMENGYQFYFLKSLGTLLEKKYLIEFNSNSCAIPRVDECHFNIVIMNMEKELGNFLKDLPIGLSLIPSLMCYEISFMQLKLFLESYFSHVSII